MEVVHVNSREEAYRKAREMGFVDVWIDDADGRMGPEVLDLVTLEMVPFPKQWCARVPDGYIVLRKGMEPLRVVEPGGAIQWGTRGEVLKTARQWRKSKEVPGGHKVNVYNPEGELTEL